MTDQPFKDAERDYIERHRLARGEPPDQQRSEAVTVALDKLDREFFELQIAERDATIAGLQQTSTSLRDAIENRDATIVELRGIILQAESYVYPGLEGTVIRNLPLSCKNLAKSEQDLLSTIAELRAEVAEQARLKDFYYEQRLRREEDVGKQIAALQEAVMLLKQRNYAKEDEIAALQARVRELEALLPEPIYTRRKHPQ